jgi:alginate O-acetyltransferase complex protein AlgI
MLFDSAIYPVFLAVVALIYWRLPHGAQNRFLLAASYFFYGWWDWRFLVLMVASTVIDFHLASAIAASPEPRRKKTLLVAALCLNLGTLGYFKYSNFFLDSLHLSHGFLNIILPPAISFYTFQEIAYVVDVYRGRLAPARSFIEYALFIGFFAHLIAGPIQRPDDLLPQVERPRAFDVTRIGDGCMLILSGLFRKCVIADSCATLANAAFAGRMGSGGVAALIGMYAFAWQVYGDFSGYSDIARGSAQVLGFRFPLNFRQPFLATSLRDFWHRWHISLSTWLRDYLYIPLGGNRQHRFRNLVITMLLGGLWHGANWTYIVWGALQGVGLAVEVGLTVGKQWWRRVVVFHFVCFGFVLFHVPSLRAAVEYFGQLAHWSWQPTYASALLYLAIFTVPLFAIDLRLEHTGEEYLFQSARYRLQIATAAAAVIAIAFLADPQPNVFFYFRF